MDVVPQAPPPTATLEESWEYLREGMDMIMGHCYSDDPSPTISYVHYMAMYAVAYNVCTSGLTPNGNTVARRGVRTNAMDASLAAAYLYSNINEYFRDYVETQLASTLPTEMDDLSLLQAYLKVWSAFSSRANYVNRLYTFLNRHWVKKQNDQSEKVSLQVFGLALKAFKEIYLAKTQSYPDHLLTDAVLRIVVKGGDDLDSTLIEKVVSSFATLGSFRPEERTENDDAPGEYQVYADSFVEATSALYKTEEERVGARRCLGRREYWGEGLKKW